MRTRGSNTLAAKRRLVMQKVLPKRSNEWNNMSNRFLGPLHPRELVQLRDDDIKHVETGGVFNHADETRSSPCKFHFA